MMLRNAEMLAEEYRAIVHERAPLVLARVRGARAGLDLTARATGEPIDFRWLWILNAQIGSIEKLLEFLPEGRTPSTHELLMIARNLFENIIWLRLFEQDSDYGLIFYAQRHAGNSPEAIATPAKARAPRLRKPRVVSNRNSFFLIGSVGSRVMEFVIWLGSPRSKTRQGELIRIQFMSLSAMLPPIRAPCAGPANAATEHSRRCRWRRHIRLTPSAEAMIAEARFLTMKKGRLTSAAMSCTADLQQMLADAASGGAGAMRPLALRSRCGEDVRLAEASIIPSSHPLSSGSSALLIIHEPPADEARVAAAAQFCFGLSLAEAEIAAQLALGHTAIAIAAGRQVSVGTVRSQVRSIFAKMRVSSQVEIAARLAGFG